jgi:hypothetical protein
MKHKQNPLFLMADMIGGIPPSVDMWHVRRRPRITHVIAENHPIELDDDDPALHDLIDVLGRENLAEFGQFISAGFRMVELVGLIDDPEDQIPVSMANDFQLNVPVLPLISTQAKLLVNALATIALRGLGATIVGPYEHPIFQRPQERENLLRLGRGILNHNSVGKVINKDLWWGEVPRVGFNIVDKDNEWNGGTPCPALIIDLFTNNY